MDTTNGTSHCLGTQAHSQGANWPFSEHLLCAGQCKTPHLVLAAKVPQVMSRGSAEPELDPGRGLPQWPAHLTSGDECPGWGMGQTWPRPRGATDRRPHGPGRSVLCLSEGLGPSLLQALLLQPPAPATVDPLDLLSLCSCDPRAADSGHWGTTHHPRHAHPDCPAGGHGQQPGHRVPGPESCSLPGLVGELVLCSQCLLTPSVGAPPQPIPHLDPGWVTYRSTQC